MRDIAQRTARLEAKSETYEHMLRQMDEKMDGRFVPRSEIDERDKAQDDKLHLLRERIDALEEGRRSAFQSWPLWVANVISVIAIIVAVVRHG